MNKKAFTLIELLLVVAIIGILAGVILVSTGSAREKAKLSKVLSTMKSIESLADACMAKGGDLVIPAYSGSGGSTICNTGTETLPSIADVSFTYCGGACGGWASSAGKWNAFSAYSDSYPGGRKIIVCGSDVNLSGWYVANYFDFTGRSGCETFGF
jgi:prepilin-type N-terminal cleavage/methylation domain-containing protein